MKKLFRNVALVLLGTLLLTTSLFAHDGGENSSVVLTPSSYDYGDIYQSDGPVSATVQVENAGESEIEINRLSTSCGCTTAEMDLEPLKPGEKREMKITFDPMVHPDQFGPVIRVVYLQTSDLVMPEMEIEITGNVLGGAPEPGDQDNAGIAEDPAASSAGSEKEVVIFFNEACQDCGELVKEFYPEFFGEYNYSLALRDYINERENRQLLNEYNKEWGVVFELQSHIETFVGEDLLIGGHVPEKIMRYLIENPDKYDKILVYQDDMHGEATHYKVWDFKGEIKTYPIDEPITTYFEDQKSGAGGKILSKGGLIGLFTLITTSAFLDGINPCAIAVLLFFIAFLFAIKRSRKSIWKIGLAYIFAIYLAYFLIGLGIAQAIIISGAPHLMAYVGSYLVIGLGVIQLLGVIFPKFPIRLRIPINTKHVLEKWLHKATLPAALIGGFLVGLCTFPCSGGIYVAIIGMLATSQSYLQGLGWMVWYNFVFIVPLLIILALAGNPVMTERLQKLERNEAKSIKIVIALTMIALGLIIIFFFT